MWLGGGWPHWIAWMIQKRPAAGSTTWQEPAEAFFGLGDVDLVNEINVEWPDGTKTTQTGVTANRVLTIYNSKGSIHTLSKWGLVVMSLLVLSAAAVLYARRRHRPVPT